jgi:hypothetical protein
MRTLPIALLNTASYTKRRLFVFADRTVLWRATRTGLVPKRTIQSELKECVGDK